MSISTSSPTGLHGLHHGASAGGSRPMGCITAPFFSALELLGFRAPKEQPSNIERRPDTATKPHASLINAVETAKTRQAPTSRDSGS